MPYTIGIDFGTESGRVVLLDLDNSDELGSVVIPYKYGVIDQVLPTTGNRLPPDWALQHPRDYMDVILEGIPKLLTITGITPVRVIGIGVDFTSCTVLPVNRDGIPLCMLSEWESRMHAWPKLWKHHAAQAIADRINDVARQHGEAFLSRYGGKVSSEWYFPKLLQVFEEDYDVYQETYRFVEAADWIVWYLTGHEKRNSCTAGYKAMWDPEQGIPKEAFFAAVNPAFLHPDEKLGTEFYPLGTRAGTLTQEVAKMLGLSNQVAVAVGNVDAMVSAPSLGMHSSGTLALVMGTSICHLTVAKEEVRLPGITGVVKDGILPGMYGYEAGQAAVGDMFAWFVKHCVPENYFTDAANSNLSIYEYLESLAVRLRPGESGLVALDWWNGNRSILADADLTGSIFGLTLATRAEETYRALLESTAFGTRMIIDNFAKHGIALDSLVAAGGLSHKSPLLMQIYADVCGLPVTVRASSEIPARGAAMFGAVAAGREAGGFDSIEDAIVHLVPPISKVYTPHPEDRDTYEKIYMIYREFYELLGRDHASLLHRLKNIRLQVT
jgi:L-ribulokinase